MTLSNDDTLGQLIKRHREKKGWSLKKLSTETKEGITPSYLSRIEQNKKLNISLKIAVDLAETLDFDLDEIIRLYTDNVNNTQIDKQISLRKLFRVNNVILNNDPKNPLFGSLKLKDSMSELLTMIFEYTYKREYTKLDFSDLVKKIEEIMHIIQETYVEDTSIKIRLNGVNFEVSKDEIFTEQQYARQIKDSLVMKSIKDNERIMMIEDGLTTVEADDNSIVLYKKGTDLRLIMFND